VPTALDLPDDLIDLQRRRLAAEAELGEYVATVERRRRELFPDPEQLLERRTWSDDETAELAQLRATRDQLALEVRHHPVLTHALEERCWAPTWEALREACRATA